VELIETDFLKGGAGNLNPTKDQLARAWQDVTHLPLVECIAFIERRLDRVIEILDTERGWSVWVPVTAEFYQQAEPDDTDWPLLLRCVAGQGRGNRTTGLHFHARNDRSCWLWMVWREFYDRVGRGVLKADIENLQRVAAISGQADGVVRDLAKRRLIRSRPASSKLRRLAKP
jgi:hypothetical protein